MWPCVGCEEGWSFLLEGQAVTLVLASGSKEGRDGGGCKGSGLWISWCKS